MLKLNRKIEYALMSLKLFEKAVEEGSLQNLTAKEIAERIGAPFEVAARVLQTLAQNQWVKVEHGSKGGYQLQKNLASMTMKDLIEVLDGPLALVKCQDGEKSCEIHHQCQIISPMQKLNDQLTQFYGQITLEKLLAEPRNFSSKVKNV